LRYLPARHSPPNKNRWRSARKTRDRKPADYQLMRL
jgi:hypothetical protein